MLLGIVRNFTRSNVPCTIEYRGGIFIGNILNGVPHGLGLFVFRRNARYDSIMFFGQFQNGQECGFGVTYYPIDGSFYHGMYSYGKLIEDSTLSDAEVNEFLTTHMFTMCEFIHHLDDDLSIEKETVEQVNSALYSSRQKFDRLLRLVSTTPGVDNNALLAITNPPRVDSNAHHAISSNDSIQGLSNDSDESSSDEDNSDESYSNEGDSDEDW